MVAPKLSQNVDPFHPSPYGANTVCSRVCVHVYKSTKVILIKVLGQNMFSVVDVLDTLCINNKYKDFVLVLVDQVLIAVCIIIF